MFNDLPVKVPGILLSAAQAFTTSTSGTTIAYMKPTYIYFYVL